MEYVGSALHGAIDHAPASAGNSLTQSDWGPLWLYVGPERQVQCYVRTLAHSYETALSRKRPGLANHRSM